MIILEKPWRIHSDELKRDALASSGPISFLGGGFAIKEDNQWIVGGVDRSIMPFVEDAIAQKYQVVFRQQDTKPHPAIRGSKD